MSDNWWEAAPVVASKKKEFWEAAPIADDAAPLGDYTDAEIAALEAGTAALPASATPVTDEEVLRVTSLTGKERDDYLGNVMGSTASLNRRNTQIADNWQALTGQRSAPVQGLGRIAPEQELTDFGSGPRVQPITARPERDLGELGDDLGLTFKQAAREGVLGMLGIPVTGINALNTGLNVSADALAGIFGGDAGPGVPMMEQPGWLQSLRADTEAQDADTYRLDGSSTLAYDDQNRPDSFRGALGYIAQNPGALLTDVSRTAGSMTTGIIPGSGTATIAAQAMQQASLAAHDVEQSLLRKGVDPQTAKAEAAKAFAAGIGIGVVAPKLVPGGDAFERVIAGQVGSKAGSTASRIVMPMLGEPISEGIEEGGIQLAQNTYARDPLMQGVGGATALGGVLGLGMGGVAGGTEGVNAYLEGRDRPAHIPTQTTPPNAAPREQQPDNAIVPDNTGLAPLGEPAPIVPPVAAAPVAPQPVAEETDDLDALLGLLGDPTGSDLAPEAITPEPVDPDAPYRRPAPTPEPLPDIEAVIADALKAMEFGIADGTESAPVAAPSPVVDLPVPLPAQTPLPELGDDTTAPAVQALPEQSAPVSGSADLAGPLALRGEIGWLERGGKMLREREEGDSDPENFLGRNTGAVVGRTPWVAPPAPDGGESQFWRTRPDKSLTEKQANAALDKFERGEPLKAIEQRFIAHAQQVAQGYADTEAAIASEVQAYEEGARLDALRALREDYAIDVAEADTQEALSLTELAQRAVANGMDEIDAAQAANESDRAYAARLWNGITEQGNGTDTRAARADIPSGVQVREGGQPAAQENPDFTLGNPEPGPAREEVARPSAGLFGAPTARDFLDATQRARDDARDGKTGTGRTDMAVGDGELFAGRRPEQSTVPDVTEASQPSLQQPGTDEPLAKIEEPQETQPTNDADMPSHLARMEKGKRDTFRVDDAAKRRATPSNWKIVPLDKADNNDLTPEGAMRQLALYDDSVSEINGQFIGGSRGASTKSLVDAWVNQGQLRTAIEQSRASDPAMWAAYDARQKQVQSLNVGDEVVLPIHVKGYGEHRATIVRKFAKNWRVRSDGGESLYPPSSLAPVPTNEADMLAGDGELFAGPRPQQASVPDAEPLESVESDPFYSALSKSVTDAKGAPKRGDATAWKGWLDGAQRRGEFKQAEREWLGVDEWLDGQQSVTREQLADYVRANEVQVEEVTLGGQGSADVESWWNDEGGANEETPFNELSESDQADAMERYREEVMDYEDGAPKFAQYQLPGGQNYRELLLTLPRDVETADSLSKKMFGAGWNDLSDEQQSEVVAASKGISSESRTPDYRSSHFDQPNILAHVRFNERRSFDKRQPYGGRVFGDNFFAREMESVLPLEVVHSGVVGLAHHDEVQRSVIAALPVDVVNLLKQINVAPQDLFSDKAVRSRAALLGADHVVRARIVAGLGAALGKAEASLRAKLIDSLTAGLPQQLLPALDTGDLSRAEVSRLLSPMKMVASDSLKSKNASTSTGAALADTASSGGKLSAADRALAADSFSRASLGAPAGGVGLIGRDGVVDTARLTSLLDAHDKIITDNERTDADGKKVLFLEEVQSDWHQAGRKKGYATKLTELPEGFTVQKRDFDTGWIVRGRDGRPWSPALPSEAEATAYALDNISSSENVPDAPFKTTWPMLVMKRMLRYAAENGFDRVAWTTGEQQAARYDLSKQVESIDYSKNNDGTFRVRVRGLNGDTVWKDDAASASVVEDTVGKEIAEKMVRGEGDSASVSGDILKLSGDGLKVGGDGMRAFYDKMLPAEVNKLAKRFGGKVGTTALPMPDNIAGFETVRADGTVFGTYGTEAAARDAIGRAGPDAIWRRGREQVADQHSLDITPDMRDAAMQGLPLFNQEAGESKPSSPVTPRTAADSRRNGRADAESLGLRAAVDKALGDAGVRVEYLRGYEGLPENLRAGRQAREEQRGGRGRTAALYDPKSRRVFVFTDVVKTPDRAVWNALHEIAGHDGLRAFLGDRLNSALNLALQNPTVLDVATAIAAERNIDMTTEKGRLLAAEEALAELAAAVRTGDYSQIESRYKVKVPEGIRERVTAAINNFLRRLKAMMDDIFSDHRFTDEDVRELLENAFQASQRKDVTGKQGEALESVQDARTAAESRRAEAASTLPVSRGTPGWNYDAGYWEGRKGQANRARAELQDKMLAWRDVQGQIESQLGEALPDAQNVYRIENLMHGRVSEGIDRIELDQIVPLVKAMKDAKVKPEQLEEYLYARHAKERNAQIAAINPAMPDGGSGMTNADADAVLADANRAVMEPLAKRVDAITRGTRTRLLNSGLITQEQHDAMAAQYSAYVPLRGKATTETDFDTGGGTAGRGVDSRAKPVKQALGRGAGNRAVNILGEVIGDAQRSVVLAEKARVGRAVMRIVLANPNPNLWTVEPVQTERALDSAGEVYEKVVNDWSDPSIVAVRHKGKLYKVEIQNQPLAQALNNVGVDQLGVVTRAAGQINRFFSAILTKYNPAFVPVNATRDALFGLTGLATEKGELVALDAALHYPKAALAAGRQAAGKSGTSEWDNWAREFAEAGGKTGYVNMPSAEDLSRKIGTGKLTGYSPDGMMRVARALADTVGILNDAVENALRLSAYVSLRKRGESAEAAAEYAKNLTVNFNRKGISGSKLNAWFLFYNAATQGAHRASKVLRKPKAYAYLGALAGAQAIATMAAMSMEDDDGEPLWNKVPDHVKRRNLVIVLPSQHVITIPMPYGFNLFTYTAGRTVDAVMNGGRGDKQASGSIASMTADLISATAESFVPVPIGDGAMGLLPTVLRIPANVQANRNDFGRPIRMEQPYAKSDVPRASMGRPDTLEIFKMTAQGLNRLGGGDNLTPPPLSWFDHAPEDIEYLLGQLTGGAGKFVVDVATMGQQAAGGDMTPDLQAKDFPITKRFVTNIDEQAAQAAMFYDRRQVVDRSLKRVRIVFVEQGEDAATKLLESTPELKGASFKRRKGDGTIILTDGRPQIVVSDQKAVFGQYKAAEKAIEDRNDGVETAYASAPASVFPTEKTRLRDASVRQQNVMRQSAQANFNAAWVRDVVGAAE